MIRAPRLGRLLAYAAGIVILYFVVLLFRGDGDRTWSWTGQGSAFSAQGGAGRWKLLPPKKSSHSSSPAPSHETGKQELIPGYNDDFSWDRSDKLLIVASTKRFGLTWVTEELKDWPHLIYMADDENPTPPILYPGRNKGNEANMYLRYIIDNYDSLPEVMVFCHGHRESLHNDLAFRANNVEAIRRLNLDHVRRIGYQSLNCGHDYICDINRTSRVWGKPDKHMIEAWPILFPADPVPPVTLFGPSYAQFSVSRATVHSRTKKDYERFHKWLMDTPTSDAISGTILELTWAYIFGKGTFYCIERDKCLSEGFGIRDLKTHMTSVGFDEDPEIERTLQRALWDKQIAIDAQKEHQQAESIFGKALAEAAYA